MSSKLKDLEKRLKDEPDNLGLRVMLAGALREANRVADAVELYRSVAVAYRDQGRSQQAIAVCRSILEIAPDDARCHGLLATLIASHKARTAQEASAASTTPGMGAFGDEPVLEVLTPPPPRDKPSALPAFVPREKPPSIPPIVGPSSSSSAPPTTRAHTGPPLDEAHVPALPRTITPPGPAIPRTPTPQAAPRTAPPTPPPGRAGSSTSPPSTPAPREGSLSTPLASASPSAPPPSTTASSTPLPGPPRAGTSSTAPRAGSPSTSPSASSTLSGHASAMPLPGRALSPSTVGPSPSRAGSPSTLQPASPSASSTLSGHESAMTLPGRATSASSVSPGAPPPRAGSPSTPPASTSSGHAGSPSQVSSADASSTASPPTSSAAGRRAGSPSTPAASATSSGRTMSSTGALPPVAGRAPSISPSASASSTLAGATPRTPSATPPPAPGPRSAAPDPSPPTLRVPPSKTPPSSAGSLLAPRRDTPPPAALKAAVTLPRTPTPAEGAPAPRSSNRLDETPLPVPLPYHVADPTTRSLKKLSVVDVMLPTPDPDDDSDGLPIMEDAKTRPGDDDSKRLRRAEGSGLSKAARRISEALIKPSPLPDLSLELDTRQRPRIESQELEKIGRPPPTVPVERFDELGEDEVGDDDEETGSPASTRNLRARTGDDDTDQEEVDDADSGGVPTLTDEEPDEVTRPRDSPLDLLIRTENEGAYGTAFFQPLPADHQKAVLDRFHKKSVKKGTTVIRQGEVGHPLVVVLKGQLLARVDRKGGAVELGAIGTGEFVGEGSLLARAPSQVQVAAATDCELLLLAPRDFYEVAGAFPALWAELKDVAERRKRDLEMSLRR